MPSYFANAKPGVLAILMRHGSTADNGGAKVVRGWKDQELTPAGRIEAQLTADKLAKYKPAKVFHSDFMRDSETAHIVAAKLNLPTEADFNLRTWDVGDYSGQPESEVNPAILRLYRTPWAMPPGSTESFNDFSRRFINYFEDRLRDAANIETYRPPVIVSHGRNIAQAHSHIDFLLPWEARMPMPAQFALINVNPDRTIGIEFIGESEPVIEDE
jgi:broad specificity phosphatase PhoE